MLVHGFHPELTNLEIAFAYPTYPRLIYNLLLPTTNSLHGILWPLEHPRWGPRDKKLINVVLA
jgi:hypothetical protein